MPSANPSLPTNYLKHTSGNFIQRLLIKNFNRSLLSLAKLANPVTVLDAGCGEGFTLDLLRQNHIGQKLTGLDYSAESIKLGKQLHPKLNISVGDIYHLPFADNSFDLVLCNEVLEHLEFPDQALSELKRVSKKYLLTSVPNEPWFQLTNFFRGKYLSSFGNHPEHINHWSAASFRAYISQTLTVSRLNLPYPWTILLSLK